MIAAAPLAPKQLVAQVEQVPEVGTMIESADGGLTWARTPTILNAAGVPFARPETVALLGSGSTALLDTAPLGSFNQLVRWERGSATASPVRGLKGQRNGFVVADPSRATWAWFCGPGGVFRSTDDGASWSVVPSTNRGEGCGSLAVEPGGGAIIYEDRSPDVNSGLPLSKTYFRRSTDAGRTWSTFRLPGVSYKAPVFDSERPGTVVIEQRQGQQIAQVARKTGIMWRSTNGGRTWRRQLRTLPTTRLQGSLIYKYEVRGELVFGAGRYLIGPLTGNKRLDSTSDCRYLTSSDHGATWRLIRAPKVKGSKGQGPDSLMPTTFGIATPYAIFGTSYTLEQPRGVVGWRLTTGTQSWSRYTPSPALAP